MSKAGGLRGGGRGGEAHSSIIGPKGYVIK